MGKHIDNKEYIEIAQELLKREESRRKKAINVPARELDEQASGERDNKERRPSRQTSFFVSGKTLYEQIYQDGKSLFLAFDTASEEAKTVSCLELEEEIIEPIKGEDVELGAVKLPSSVEEYGSTLALLAAIEQYLYRYLDLSENFRKFASYYILLSWLFDRFHTIPYLRALGDTGCGKSRFLDVIGGLCYKPISASGCVTPAPIYRMLRKWRGTLVLDEADMRQSDEYNEVVTILNCGFERGRPVLRATKDNPDKVQVLPVYGPKVFATRRRFKDVALEARCLTEIMQETTREDIPPVLGKKFFEEQQSLRNKLLLFRLQNYFKVDPEAAANIDLGGIEPRLRQVFQAFTSLFASNKEVLEDYKNFIQGHQQELIEQRAITKTGQVVNTLFELLEQATGSPYSIVPNVPYVPDVPDGEVLPVSSSDIAGKLGMTPQAVGQMLRGLGLSARNERAYGARKRYLICNRGKLEILHRRYVLKDIEADSAGGTSGTIGTYPMGNRDNVPEEENFADLSPGAVTGDRREETNTFDQWADIGRLIELD